MSDRFEQQLMNCRISLRKETEARLREREEHERKQRELELDMSEGQHQISELRQQIHDRDRQLRHLQDISLEHAQAREAVNQLTRDNERLTSRVERLTQDLNRFREERGAFEQRVNELEPMLVAVQEELKQLRQQLIYLNAIGVESLRALNRSYRLNQPPPYEQLSQQLRNELEHNWKAGMH